MSLSEKVEAARVAARVKRKEQEMQAQGLAPPEPAAKIAKPGKPTTTPQAPQGKGGSGSGSSGNNNNNKLLAGHLAHEFLSRGTLLGRRFDPTRGGPAPAAPPAAADAEKEPNAKRRYVEVSWLLMSSGAHIPGVVNPTQLGRWLQIKE